MMLYFNKRARQRLAKVMPAIELKRIEHVLNMYAVVDTNGTVVTVGFRTHRINHN